MMASQLRDRHFALVGVAFGVARCAHGCPDESIIFKSRTKVKTNKNYTKKMLNQDDETKKKKRSVAAERCRRKEFLTDVF